MNDKKKDGNGKDKDKKVLPFRVVDKRDKREADEPPITSGMPSTEEQENIKACWEKVAAILTEYNAEFTIDAPPIEIRIGEQITSFNIPVKYGIRIKRQQA